MLKHRRSALKSYLFGQTTKQLWTLKMLKIQATLRAGAWPWLLIKKCITVFLSAWFFWKDLKMIKKYSSLVNCDWKPQTGSWATNGNFVLLWILSVYFRFFVIHYSLFLSFRVSYFQRRVSHWKQLSYLECVRMFSLFPE